MAAYVYLLANHKSGTLYAGVTSDPIKRISQHREKTYGGFTARYGVNKLVYYEVFDEIVPAIEREKEIKKWHRTWKIVLIENANPDWKDIFPTLMD